MPKYNIIRGGMHHLFMNSRKKIQVLAGGFGNGKTAAVVIKAIKLCMDYPGCNGLIARATYPKLNDTIRREFYKWVPNDAVKRWPTKDDNTLIFKNGSTVNFRYISQRGKASNDGQVTSNLLSATYDWCIVDQMEDPEIQYKDFLDLLGRMRGSTPYKGDDETMPITGPRWMMLTANPTANWFYKKLIKPYHRYKATGLVDEELIHDEDTLEPMIEIFEGSTYENKHNLDADFIKTLEASYKGQMRERFLMGKWAAYEGLVYPDYSTETHMIPHKHVEDMIYEASRMRSPFTAIEGFDFGIVNPSCYLFGFRDYIGRIFWCDGFYEAHMSLEDIESKILEIRGKYYIGVDTEDPIWADPAIFKKTVVRGGRGSEVSTVAKILQESNELYIKPAQNDVLQGIRKVTEYLSIREYMHYLDSEKDGPMMYFSDKLTFVEDEIVAYFWRSNSEGERLDEPNDRDDHAMDVIKYSVSKLPEASTLHYKKPIITPEYLKWQEAPD